MYSAPFRFILLMAFCAVAVSCSRTVSHAAESAKPNGSYENLYYYRPAPKADPAQTIEADVCVYGATPGGITAAIQATRMGKTAVLIEFGRHIGGMTASGLSRTDGGRAAAGISSEFYAVVGTANFTPQQAETQFKKMLDDAGVKVFYSHHLATVEKDGAAITRITMENGNIFKAKMFVDATYEGDLLAMAKVSFHVGREANAVYKETINGIRLPGKSHNFRLTVDPYIVPGDPSSGVLPGISNTSPDAPGKTGEGDARVQAYNFRMFFAHRADALPFPKPPGYDAGRYELLLRYIQAGAGSETLRDFMQARLGDSNNDGGFSTDHIGANYRWPEGSYAEREKIFQDHVNYQQGLMYFLSNDERIPQKIRDQVNEFGLAKGNFPETGGWPHQLYVREGRRMVSDYVMTEHNCRSTIVAEDSVGLAEYTMDSHNVQRYITKDASGKPMVKNEGDVQDGVPHPYPVSYRSIVPREKECPNLLVPVCLSSSHMAYGSIRMEPVFMVLGQSAATAAAMAIDAKIPVQQVPYGKLRERLIADKQALEWNGLTGTKPIKLDAKKPGVWRIICFGDNLTERGYPAKLGKLLPKSEVVNVGMPGNTTAMGLMRLEKHVTSHQPDVVVILFGTNDIRVDSQIAVPADQYRSNLGKMVDACNKAGAKVVLCAIPPIDPAQYFARHEKRTFDAAGGLDKLLADYRAAAKGVAAEHGATWLDLNEQLKGRPEWLGDDGVNPSAKGTQLIAQAVADAVSPLINQKKAS